MANLDSRLKKIERRKAGRAILQYPALLVTSSREELAAFKKEHQGKPYPSLAVFCNQEVTP